MGRRESGRFYAIQKSIGLTGQSFASRGVFETTTLQKGSLVEEQTGVSNWFN